MGNHPSGNEANGYAVFGGEGSETGHVPALSTLRHVIRAPLAYQGKVRELYDLGEHWLIAVSDRISAFDYVLSPPIPGKGAVLNRISAFWFDRTAGIQRNHMVHADAARLVREGVAVEKDLPLLDGRIMVCRKAERIDMECIVRGYVTGGGWRQYAETGSINGIRLPEGLRKNERLPEPIFTPSAKNDVGHDEDIPFEEMARRIGADLAEELKERSLALYRFAGEWCEQRGILLADCKFEFGRIDGEIVLIDELFTPDSSRFWAKESYALGTDIDSMDKEPVRRYLAESGWDKNSPPDPLPDEVVRDTARRYAEIYRKIVTTA